MTPRFLAMIFDYPFKVCDVKKIIVPVDSSETQKALTSLKKWVLQKRRELKTVWLMETSFCIRWQSE
jgi:hypothetical protein